MKMKGPRRFHILCGMRLQRRTSLRKTERWMHQAASLSSASCSRGTKSNEKPMNRRTVTSCLASLGERG